MSATTAFITPNVLVWARRRTGATVEDTAGKVNVRPDKLEAWERGKERPSMRQAQHLAAALHVPFGYLFLSEPPREQLPISDFRTKKNAALGHASADLLDVLYDVLLKQDWYREFIELERGEKLPFVGKFNAGDDPLTIAKDISDNLAIDDGLRESCSSWEEFMRTLVTRAERIGVLVLRSGIVGSNPHRSLDTNEFRGFAISDDFAPIVFINSTDSRAAQLFTLMHELSHIWLGQSGISNEELRDVSSNPSDTEEICNQIAAETLVPAALFETRWQKNTPLDVNLASMRRYFRVSNLVLLRRAYDLKQINRNAYYNHFEQEMLRYSAQEATTGGGNFFNNFFARNGAPFAHAVVGAVYEGKTNYRDAARLLNVKVPTIHKIAEQINLKKGR